MIALETNVLVRLVIRDDDAQSDAAERVVRRSARTDEALYVADAVLCEFTWTLQAVYKVARRDVAAALQQLLESDRFQFEDRSGVERAVQAFRDRKGGFADSLIRERALAAGASAVVTFDRALRADAAFRVLGDRRRP